MHPKISLPGIGLLLLAAMLFLMPGCSDDKNPVPSTGFTAGDLENPEFLLVQDQINNFLHSTEETFLLGFENVYQLPTDTEYVRNHYGPMGPDDIVEYNYIEGWHITYIAHFNPYADDYFRDSVQFQIASEPVEDPEGLDALYYIRHWGYTSNEVDVTHTNRSGYANLQFTELDQDFGVVNGVNNSIVEWNYISEDSTVEAVYNIEMNINDITVGRVATYGWVSGCPREGRVNLTVDQAYSVNYGESSDFWVRNWDVRITFENGLANVNISSENQVWNYEYEVCNPAGA
ncbi:MAG: hypothetical protein CVT49_01545 [candidate division Zixibacteria bacterium HGW-Zixibacteria-1]|nr:MAG: hypothetical protein CVT49_01545 [candidate division Zixibacteria bacterium HGW-Zixibacteria-1]